MQKIEDRADLKYGLKEVKEPETMTTTVGLKKDAAPEQATVAVAEAPRFEGRKTYTNWHALFEAGVTPTYINCKGYFPIHPFNSGCHTLLQLNPEQLAAHMDRDHGGGFFMSFKEGYQNNPDGNIVRIGRPWEGWHRFEELGLEIRDLRCDICNEEIKLTPRSILRHCKAHTGKSSRNKPGGDFWMTISRDTAQVQEDDE